MKFKGIMVLMVLALNISGYAYATDNTEADNTEADNTETVCIGPIGAICLPMSTNN